MGKKKNGYENSLFSLFSFAIDIQQGAKTEVCKFLMVSKVAHSGFACSNDKLECYLQLHQFTPQKKNNYQDGK